MLHWSLGCKVKISKWLEYGAFKKKLFLVLSATSLMYLIVREAIIIGCTP